LLYVPNAGLTDLEAMGLASKNDRFTRTDGTHLGTSMGGTPESMNEFNRLEMFAKVQKAPPVKFKDLEAVVESKITYNLLPFQIRTDFIKITNDTVLAALTVQIANHDMTFQNRDGLQHAAVNVFGRVSTLSRRVVQTFEEVVTVDTPAGSAGSIAGSPKRLLAGVAVAPRPLSFEPGAEGYPERQRGNHRESLYGSGV
jgi:hypothetical protein